MPLDHYLKSYTKINSTQPNAKFIMSPPCLKPFNYFPLLLRKKSQLLNMPVRHFLSLHISPLNSAQLFPVPGTPQSRPHLQALAPPGILLEILFLFVSCQLLIFQVSTLLSPSPRDFACHPFDYQITSTALISSEIIIIISYL